MKINGKKTYIVGTLTIVFAVVGLVLGKVEASSAIEMILAALGGMSLRHGIK